MPSGKRSNPSPRSTTTLFSLPFVIVVVSIAAYYYYYHLIIAVKTSGGVEEDMSSTLFSPLSFNEEERVFPIPEAIVARQPHIDSPETYRRLHQESIEQPDAFWLRCAHEWLEWKRKPSVAFEGDFAEAKVSWFRDGQLNVAVNCLDRHDPTKIALIWEGDEPGQSRQVTYGDLLKSTCQVANWMRSMGVKEGDRVAIYMPMIPETVVAMLACARIGAVHNVVFAGFSAESLADRLVDSQARLLLTANEGVRGGRIIPLKVTVDAALKLAQDRLQSKVDVLVYARTDKPTSMLPGRDVWWHEAIPGQATEAEPFIADAEHPLFILYTSGSTGKPKGLLHTSAGYLLYAMMTHRYVFDYHSGDIYGCLADVGWITGHSYIVYGPLANGATTVLFESTPVYPTPSRYWQLVERLKLTQLYTAPTVIRALRKFGTEPLKGYDLSPLRILGTVGEPINPDAWYWYWEEVGRGNCAVMDTYWQTETGGHVLTPLPGAIPTKAGSATLPFFGILPKVIDQHSGQATNSSDGVLCVSRPWPGMARSIYGDHAAFHRIYFQPYPGYYFTGDRVHVDADGYHWIRGRVDDVINVSGHRLSTAEVEAALGKHQYCAEAAVLGRADDITGQSIWAFCILKPEGKNADKIIVERELSTLVRTTIGAFAAPKRILLVSDLPKTRSGKIMRRIIRKILEADPRTATPSSILASLGDTTTLSDPDIVHELIRVVHEADTHSS